MSWLSGIFADWRRSRRQEKVQQHFAAALRQLRAKYDAAQTTDENRRHWMWADGLSAREANSPSVRQILRNRSRYEVANNCHANRIVHVQANSIVGTGPRLQLMTPDKAANKRVEQSFNRWCKRVGLAKKLRTMRMAQDVDGEAFALLGTNPRLRHQVQLDLRVIEADQIATPDLSFGDRRAVDGITFDEWDNPLEYHLLRAHPGDGAAGDRNYDRIPAEQMLHLFRADRPGQVRGIPGLTPALPLFSLWRRFKLATALAAEIAASLAGILYTDGSPGDHDEVDPFLPIDFERGALTSMPSGWKLAQLKAEHPITTLDMFEKSLLREIAGAVCLPFNVAAGDSSGYNYASGRLDFQAWFRLILIEQTHIANEILDRILDAWLDEAVLITGLLPAGLGPFDEWAHCWFWDGFEHVDPGKEATAQGTKLANGTTHRGREYARQGLDVDTEDEAAAESWGVTVQEYRAALFARTFGMTQLAPPEDDEEEDDEQEVTAHAAA